MLFPTGETPTASSTSVQPSHATDRPPPNGWRWVRLGEVCSIHPGQHVLETDYNRNGIGIGYLTGPADFGERCPHITKWTEKPKAWCEPGDVLVTVKGAGVGKTNLAPDEKVAIGRQLMAIRPVVGQADQLYIYYVLITQFSRLQSDSVGATVPGLGRDAIEGLVIPITSLAEQRRIAAILAEQMVAVEQARAAAAAQLITAQRLPGAYLRATFSVDNTGLWPHTTLGDVCQLLPSKSIATAGDTEVSAITTSCLTETGFDPTGIKSARMWGRDAAECVVTNGEILVARSNTADLVGRVAMFEGEPVGAVATDLTIRIAPGSMIYAPFLAAYLSSLYLSGHWKRRAGGASDSMKKITRTQLLSSQVPIPSVGEQRRVATPLRKVIAEAARVRVMIEAQLTAIDRLPAALLRRAFAGDL
jgi:type I restriction enzyme S subunit